LPLTTVLVYLLLFLPKGDLQAQEANRYWIGTGFQKPGLLRTQQEHIRTQSAYYLRIDPVQLANQLKASTVADFSLPAPEGQAVHFQLESYEMLEEGLAEKYPELKTFRGQALNQQNTFIYLTYSPGFFQATVTGPAGTWYIDPYAWPADHSYQSYYRTACREAAELDCRWHQPSGAQVVATRQNTGSIEGLLRRYRLAVSATYSYYDYFGRDLARTMAGIVATINRVNMVYEQDLGIRLVLVANNDSLIITDPDDPIFTRDYQEDTDNQLFIDEVIGSENYDVGHVLSAGGGGGYASLSSVCDDAVKAQGVTGLRTPQGDAFDIDFVAHELGHQFGANHTFNGVDGSCGGAWYPFTAFEPGAGTTIMAYAGLCGSDNVTPGSDAYFHGGSIVEINNFLLTFGGCAEVDTLARPAAILAMPADEKYLPILTPFELQADALATDGTALLYSWEQVDRGVQLPLGSYGAGNEPLFRSFPPDTSALRVFPRLSDLLENRPQAAELLPNTSRELTFQLTARAADTLGTAISWSEVAYRVAEAAGPFRVDNPAQLNAGQLQVLEWAVNGTDVYPVSADSVVLNLSVDGGQDFSWALDTFPNTGRAVFAMPDVAELRERFGSLDISDARGRLKLKALNHIFFDLNDGAIAIDTLTAGATFVRIIADTRPLIFCESDTIRWPVYYNAFAQGEKVAAHLSLQAPDFSYSVEEVTPGLGMVTLSGSSLPTGVYPVDFIAQIEGAADTFRYELQLQGQDAGLEVVSLWPGAGEIDVALRPWFSWNALATADEYRLEVALDSAFEEVVAQSPAIQDTVFQLVEQLPDTTDFYWRVKALNTTCGTSGSSPVRQFTTEQVYCLEYYPTDLPMVFDALPFIQSDITIAEEASILDVNVRDIRGVYDNPGGLEFSLRSPEGPIIKLLNKQYNCLAGEGFAFSVDDEAGSTFVPCPNDTGFVFAPAMPLRTFDGQRTNGRWNLTIFDDGGAGQLDSWVLEICFGAPAGSVISSVRRPELVMDEVRVYPNPLGGMLHLESRQTSIVQFRIVDMLGRVVLTQNNIQSQSHRLELPDLPKGAYVYQLLLADGRMQSGKLLR